MLRHTFKFFFPTLCIHIEVYFLIWSIPLSMRTICIKYLNWCVHKCNVMFRILLNTLKKKFDDTDIIVVPWPILYWRFTENQCLLVLVQAVCVYQTYELLLQQNFWLTVKYILLNYLKKFSYIHMPDKSQAFLSVYCINYRLEW